jgi:mono/diheme cytochrome c family protein
MRAKGMPPAPVSGQQTHALWTYLNSMQPPAHRAPGVPAVVIFKVANAAPVHESAAAPVSAPVRAAARAEAPAPMPQPQAKAPAVAAAPVNPRPAAPPVEVRKAAAVAAPVYKGDPAAGREIYTANPCMACHGPTAKGTPIAPPLAGIGHYLSESTFDSLIHHPNAPMRSKGMPPATISQRQTADLWAYLNSMQPPAHRAPGVPAVVIFKVKNAAPASAPAPASVSAAPEKVAVTEHPAAKPLAEATLSGPALQGEHFFVSHGCIACHGENGVGTRLAISLIGITHKVPHDQLMSLIRHPNARMKAGGMPTFTFTDSDMSNLLAYLAQLHRPAAGEKAAAAVHHLPPHKLTAEEEHGRQVYFHARCSTCHGDGGMEGTAAAPSLTATASELPPDLLRHLLEHPSDAMQSHGMPPVSLNQPDLKALIAYIRALRYNR